MLSLDCGNNDCADCGAGGTGNDIIYGLLVYGIDDDDDEDDDVVDVPVPITAPAAVTAPCVMLSPIPGIVLFIVYPAGAQLYPPGAYSRGAPGAWTRGAPLENGTAGGP